MSDDPGALILEFLALREWLSAESKRFAEHCKPHKERMETIRNLMLVRANQESKNPHDAWSIRLDTGTAYRSTTMSPKVQDRDAFLDFIFGEEPHEEFLQISAPQVDAVRDWMEAHEGKPPPGVHVEFNTTVNIRKG